MDDSETAFAAARQRLAVYKAKDHDRIGELGKTIALVHGTRTDKAALLLHGLTASPTQFIQIARALHEMGYNVLVPRLSRHGYADRMTDALKHLRIEDLKRDVSESLAIIRGLGKSVTVSGFSLGGLLAAWVAQNEDVDLAAPIAAYFGIAWVPSIFSLLIADVALALPDFYQWWNPLERERQMPAHGYPRYTSHSLALGYKIAHEVLSEARARPPRARRIIMIGNASESAVNNRAIRRLIRMWRSHAPDRRGSVETYVLRNLPPSHDIIEPLRNPRVVERVFPELMRILTSG